MATDKPPDPRVYPYGAETDDELDLTELLGIIRRRGRVLGIVCLAALRQYARKASTDISRMRAPCSITAFCAGYERVPMAATISATTARVPRGCSGEIRLAVSRAIPRTVGLSSWRRPVHV